MGAEYTIDDVSRLLSPSLLFFKDLIARNIAGAMKMAREPGRLRPHVKTHKTREIVRMELDAGIRKHKCATVAEAEMLAQAGAPDVLLAYPIVGPNCERVARLVGSYPESRFRVLGDHPGSLGELSETMVRRGQKIDVLVDVDCGQERTGVGPERVEELYELIDRLPGMEPGGLHVYDGHHHQPDIAERRRAVEQLLGWVLPLRDRLVARGFPVPRLVVGGTPTFPFFARLESPEVECSPGTCILHDQGYGSRFPDLSVFRPAALLLTRVVSRPRANRVTLDLGTKAVASDPPAGQRLAFLGVSDYRAVLHNEEHLVIETPEAARFRPGDTVLAVPTHICPTCALHRTAYVVEEGRVAGEWSIVARDRVLTV